MSTKAPVPATGPGPSTDPPSMRAGMARIPLSGGGSLAFLGLAFCSLPFLTWVVSGVWLPEVMVFGLAAGLVGWVSTMR